MNIPDYRSAISGRTWSQSWNPSAGSHYRSRRHFEVIDALFAIGLGLLGAAVLFWWLSK